ncbi:hypothetical protein B0A50_02696 [Salinomyces thailandicus]|uniref:DNL-type domain-containing protein n=1 Tax=Salinomyces thailandicus TaxID=706561 RepID=A0A4U0U609_9PEZI|nr:hypothetical protein B0A50_02696 [Salinomyces thailandica]
MQKATQGVLGLRNVITPIRVPRRTARGLHGNPSSPAPPTLRKHLCRPSTVLRANQHYKQQLRHESSEPPRSTPAPRPLTDSEPTQADPEEAAARKAQEPAYEMTFTCRKCVERSSHRVTKQAYHFGTTLITCPGCKSRHLISDHLKIFSDKSITLEDILKEKGQYLQKGRLGEDGDVEFYDDKDSQRV